MSTDEFSSVEELKVGGGTAAGASREDVFYDAVQAVCSAETVRQMAKEGKRKLRVLEELYVRARLEMEGLHAVARGVTAAAASVAIMALEACRYPDFRTAFTANPDYSKHISLDTFLDVVNGDSSSSSPRDSNRSFASQSISRSRQQAGPFGQGRMTSLSDRNSPLDPLLTANCPSGGMPSADHAPPSPSASWRDRRHSLPLAVPQPLSPLRGSHPDNPALADALEKRPPRNTSDDKFQEKFPHVGVDAKSSLASSISQNVLDGTMTPLWEDRYVQPRPPAQNGAMVAPAAPGRGQWVIAPGNWEERKTRRQFLNKLQKVGADLDHSSLEEIAQSNRTPGDVATTESDNQQPTGGKAGGKQKRKAKKHLSEKSADQSSPRAYDAGDESTSSDEEVQCLTSLGALMRVKVLDDVQGTSGRSLSPRPSPSPDHRALSPLLSAEERRETSVSPNCSSQTTRAKGHAAKYYFHLPGNVTTSSDTDQSVEGEYRSIKR